MRWKGNYNQAVIIITYFFLLKSTFIFRYLHKIQSILEKYSTVFKFWYIGKKSLHEKFEYCTQKLRAIVVNLHRQTAEWIKLLIQKFQQSVDVSFGTI